MVSLLAGGCIMLMRGDRCSAGFNVVEHVPCRGIALFQLAEGPIMMDLCPEYRLVMPAERLVAQDVTCHAPRFALHQEFQ